MYNTSVVLKFHEGTISFKTSKYAPQGIDNERKKLKNTAIDKI